MVSAVDFKAKCGGDALCDLQCSIVKAASTSKGTVVGPGEKSSSETFSDIDLANISTRQHIDGREKTESDGQTRPKHRRSAVESNAIWLSKKQKEVGMWPSSPGSTRSDGTDSTNFICGSEVMIATLARRERELTAGGKGKPSVLLSPEPRRDSNASSPMAGRKTGRSQGWSSLNRQLANGRPSAPAGNQRQRSNSAINTLPGCESTNYNLTVNGCQALRCSPVPSGWATPRRASSPKALPFWSPAIAGKRRPMEGLQTGQTAQNMQDGAEPLSASWLVSDHLSPNDLQGMQLQQSNRNYTFTKRRGSFSNHTEPQAEGGQWLRHAIRNMTVAELQKTAASLEQQMFDQSSELIGLLVAHEQLMAESQRLLILAHQTCFSAVRAAVKRAPCDWPS